MTLVQAGLAVQTSARQGKARQRGVSQPSQPGWKTRTFTYSPASAHKLGRDRVNLTHGAVHSLSSGWPTHGCQAGIHELSTQNRTCCFSPTLDLTHACAGVLGRIAADSPLL